MNGIVRPARHETIGNGKVRVFAARVGRQDLLALDDLCSALGVQRAARDVFLTAFRSSRWASEVQTFATPAGLVVAVPLFAAQGLANAHASGWTVHYGFRSLVANAAHDRGLAFLVGERLMEFVGEAYDGAKAGVETGLSTA